MVVGRQTLMVLVCFLWTYSSAFGSFQFPMIALRPGSSLFSLKQQKGESSSAYFLRLQDAARDPKKFEEMCLSRDEDEEDIPIQTGKGYQRIEDWDAETTQDNSWEEMVRYDGQRFGNRFKQNNILLKNLNNGL